MDGVIGSAVYDAGKSGQLTAVATRIFSESKILFLELSSQLPAYFEWLRHAVRVLVSG